MHGLTELQLYKDRDHKYRWRLVAGNGKIIGASSQGFTQKGGCKRNYQLVEHSIRGAIYNESHYLITDLTDIPNFERDNG